PTFILQTDEDKGVPAENAVAFYLALRRHHVPTEMHIYQSGPHGIGLRQGDPILGTWGAHFRDWLRSNGFLSTVKRAQVIGSVTVNGKPVSWGTVVFTPANSSDPEVAARITNGKFKLGATIGASVGNNTLKVVYSAADVPSLSKDAAPGGIIETQKKSASEKGDLGCEIKEGSNILNIELAVP
ncbi:MAG: hypothetical protein WCL08_08070, partial [Verrucomicrobiota bacterium]